VDTQNVRIFAALKSHNRTMTPLIYTLRFFFKYTLLSLILFSGTQTAAAENLTLEEVLDLLRDHNPTLDSAEARQLAAEADLTTARAYPNPELEIGGGTSTGLGEGALHGGNEYLFVSQPLDLPFVRAARREVAEAGIDSAEQANYAVWLIVRAKTRQAFYHILRRQAELAVTQDNERILEQIRDKIKLKLEIGEAAGYEAVKADAELLNAVKLRTAAAVQVEDAKSALRALFAGALPFSFDIAGDLPPPPKKLPNLDSLRTMALDRQPMLQHVRAEVQKAEAQLNLEKQLRYPRPTLKAGVEQDPGLKQWRVGITLPLPLWNQRQGPIARAHADLRQSKAEALQQELKTLRELENAYNRYTIADRQVYTFENGLLQQAKKTLQVAEAAYRLGERGILDYLDAQRTYRSVRNDYLNARFDRQNALIDLERLIAEDIKG
jgi:cobalt-zinc-cadmium efflux system outer membrane protein